MIRILHTSDSHWDARGRLQDVVDVHRAMLQVARDESVDAIVHAGDFFDRRSCPEERTALANWLHEAAEVAPVYGVKGNHDQAGDLEIFNRLDTVYPIRIEERVTLPGEAFVPVGSRVAFLGMAWIDKAHLAATFDAGVRQDQTVAATIAAIRDLLGSLRAEAARVRRLGLVPIMATHVMLGGSVVATGQLLIGMGVELSPTDLLDVGAAYVACGHIHASQAWFDGRVAYSGSPNRCNFGEPEPKGVRLVTLTDEGELVSNEFRELPARRIELLECDWSTAETAAPLREAGIDPLFFGIRQGWDLRGALVRFRYHVRVQDLALVNERAIEMALHAEGAEEVVIEAVVEHETRARSTEIAAAATTASKVDAYFAAKGLDLEPPQLARVHEKLQQIEAA